MPPPSSRPSLNCDPTTMVLPSIDTPWMPKLPPLAGNDASSEAIRFFWSVETDLKALRKMFFRDFSGSFQTIGMAGLGDSSIRVPLLCLE